MLSDVYAAFEKQMADNQIEVPYVKGTGPENAAVMLIGEAPGREEIREGKPFVGKAGQNLNEFLCATGIKREELFITNVVKFRPTKVSEKGTVSNRAPNKKEIALCAKCLLSEIETVRPKVIVTLGNTALKAVLADETASIGNCHGREIRKEGRLLFPLYHPASIIYRRELKPVYEADLTALQKSLTENRLLGL